MKRRNALFRRWGGTIAVIIASLLPVVTEAGVPYPSILGVSSAQTGFGVQNLLCRDGRSNLFVGGYFTGVFNYGALNLTNTNSSVAIFASLLNSSGNPLRWTNSTASMTPIMAVPNPIGGMALVCYYHGPLGSVPGSTLVSTSDWGTLVLSLNASGSLNQSFILEANGTNNLNPSSTNPGPPFAVVSAQYDQAGNFYIGGNFINALRVSGTSGFFSLASQYGTNDQDYFVAKFGSNGAAQWAEQGGSPAMDELFDMTIDSLGNTFIVGGFGGTNVLGTSSLISPVRDGDGFVWKLDANGNVLWGQQASEVVSGFSRDFHGVLSDGTGGCYLAGVMTFDPTATNGNSLASFNAFIAHLNNSSSLQWSTQLIASNGNVNVQLGADTNGNIYAAGDFDDNTNNAVSLGGQFTLLPSGVDDNLFVAKVSAAGSFQWAQQMTAQSIQEFDVDPMGNTFILGAFDSSDTPGNTNLATRGDSDTFITKLDTSGNFDWTVQVGGPQANWAGELTPDTSGGVYFIGFSGGMNYVQNTPLPGSGAAQSFVTRIVDAPGTNAPSILFQPQSQTSFDTNSDELEVTAIGAGPLTYQWQFNGADITGATNAWLTLSNVQLINTGAYSVVVSNSLGSSVTSSNATLTVIDSLSTVYSFGSIQDTNGGLLDGAIPYAALVLGPDGSMYGTTTGGGSNAFGTVFRITTNGALTSLYSFGTIQDGNGDPVDGSHPYAPLVLGPDGNLYGTTSGGGSNGNNFGTFGTVFRITTNGALTSLYSFGTIQDTNGDPLDGAYPYAALVLGTDGSMYGTTTGGGSNGPNQFAVGGFGTVFRITTNGALTTLYSFGTLQDTSGNPLDGYNPYAALVLGADGSMYGTATGGGSNASGIVFRITTNGALTSLYSFGTIQDAYGDPLDGAYPNAPLVLGTDGSMYGTTSYGGTNIGFGGDSFGTVFRITTNGTLTTLYSFGTIQDVNGNALDGAMPDGGLVQGSDGDFYGTTTSGGDNDMGTLFQIISNGIFTNLYRLAGAGEGVNPYCGLIRGSDGSFYGTTEYGGTTGNGTVFRFSLLGASRSPPTFQAIIRTNGTVTFTWSAVAGQTNQIQYKTNLNQTIWSNFGPPIVAGTVTLSASDFISNAPRFYRIVLLP